MARDGNGNYSLPQPAFVSSTTISSTAVNSDFSDIATALTASIAKDGQTTYTANQPMGGFKHTNIADATARNQYASLGQLQDSTALWCGTAGGTGNAFTLTPAPAISAYVAGQEFSFLAANANTGATTVAISGLAAKNVFLSAACQGGEIVAGKAYKILYDGTQFELIPLECVDTQPLVVGSADATKRVRLEVDGLTTGTTRVLTVQDAAGTLALTSEFAYANLASISGRLVFPRGYINGCEIANNAGDAVNDIDFAAGACRDSTNTVNIINGSTITKRLDATWVVGTGNGGLDTGVIADTTYHCYLIRKDSDGTVDALFSTSPTTPLTPGGYTYFRRVGSIIRVAGTIVAFSQFGNEFLKAVPTRDLNTGALSTTAILTPLAIPTGVKMRAQIAAYIDRAGTAFVLVTSPDQADTVPSVTVFTLQTNASAGVFNNLFMTVRTDTSAQIRSRSSAATTSHTIMTFGWFDERL